MTCREKLKIEHPDEVKERYYGGCCGCPHTYGYLDPPDRCAEEIKPSEEDCRVCWDREIPETSLCKCYDEQCQCCNGTRERDACFCGGHELKCDFYPEKREKAKNDTEVKPHISDHLVEQITNAGDAAKNASIALAKLTEQCGCSPHILDSGNRRQFESGAVRDIQEGKGRCDLLPLDTLSVIYGDSEAARVFACFADFIKYRGDWTCLTDTLKYAESNMFAGRYDMILEVAKHFEEGCKKYGERNWEKGIDVHCYVDSAIRHYLKWLRGDQDEPHDRAFVWNILCCIWTCRHKPELNDYRGETKLHYNHTGEPIGKCEACDACDDGLKITIAKEIR